MPEELRKAIQALGKKAPEAAVREVILRLCEWNDFSLAELATTLGRSESHIQEQYLTPMIRAGSLEFTIPAEPNHPKQNYRAAKKAGK